MTEVEIPRNLFADVLRRIAAAAFRAAELGRNGAACDIDRPNRGRPVLHLLSP
jgi:hypothetical protein